MTLWEQKIQNATHLTNKQITAESFKLLYHISGTCGLVAFRVILGSFGALAIFLKIRFPKQNTFSTNLSQNLLHFS